MPFAYCKSKDCANTEFFGGRDNKKPSKFCGKCGSEMLTSCPNCNHYRNSTEDSYCTNCGKPYK